MLKKTAFLPAIFACILTLGSVPYALAGDVKLVSGTLDSVCRVEITWGRMPQTARQLNSIR
jgi:hypothetical protein